MNMINKAVKMTMAFLLLGSAVFAQSVTDAKKALDAEQYQKAKTILKSLIASKPSEPENYFFLGNAYLKTTYADSVKAIDSAKAAYNKGIAADNEYPLNYIGLGSIDLKANNTAAAKAHFDKAISLIKKKKKEYEPYLYIGEAYLNAPKPDYNAALQNLNEAKSINDKDAEIFLALGDAYRGQKNNSEAYSAYRTAFDLDNTMLRAKIELGVITKESKAFPEAVNQFKTVISTNPNYGPAYRELAETYYLWSYTDEKEHESRLDQALEYYKKYMDLTDRSLESRMRYADFLILTQHYKELQQEAQAMSQLDKANPRIYRYLGYSAYENGNYDASIKALQDFIGKVDSARVIGQDYLYLGKAQLKADSVAAASNKIDSATLISKDSIAISNFAKAVEMDSTNAAGLSDIAKNLFNEKKYGRAADVYALSVKDPKASLLDYFYKGMAYYFDYGLKQQANQNPGKDLLVKADSSFSYLLQKAPTTEQAILYRARIHRLMDDAQDSKGLAAPYYEDYIKLVTVTDTTKQARSKNGLVEAYNYLGLVAAKRDNDNAKATGYFNKVLALDPSNATAQQALKAMAPAKG